MVKEAIKKAAVLIEALPYIKSFHKKVTVIKYGGSILSEERVRKAVLEDIAFLRYTGMCPILVHGGGPNISEALKKKKVKTKFIGGLRITDKETLKVVAQELDKLNDVIVKEIESHHIKASGFKSGNIILKAAKKESEADLGFVGKAVGMDAEKIKKALKDSIPVICPLGISDNGDMYNINADEAACFIARELEAEKIVLLTNVLGVMRNPKDEESLMPTLSSSDIGELIEENTIGEGMIPKVKAAVSAVNNGVKKGHIIDAKIQHALLLEMFTNEGIGTEIIADVKR